MSKKTHPVSQVLKLIAGLTDDQKEIVRDFLRQPRSSKSPNPAPRAAGKSSSKKSEKKDTSIQSSPMNEAGALSVAAGSSGGEG